jgi:hypothetical protein
MLLVSIQQQSLDESICGMGLGYFLEDALFEKDNAKMIDLVAGIIN